MFGFGGGFNGPGGGSTNSGSAPSGKTSSGGGTTASQAAHDVGAAAHGVAGHDSSDNGGHEGSTSGPGNPGHSTSSANSNAGREGQRAGPGNPDAGHSVDPARFGGGSPGGGIDPARFGGTPTGMSPTGVTRGFGAAMGATTAETDLAAQARAAERKSMDTYNTAARTREDNARMADLAATRRADENKSVGTYNAAAALSDANAQRADAASTARVAENTSMNPFHDALNNFLGITRKAEAGLLDPYNRVVAGKKGTPDYADITNMTVQEAADYASKLTGKPSHVLGGYQFKDTTLTSIADEMGIPRDAKMSQDIQSQLAIGLAQRRANKATVNGVVDKDKFAREMAKEWASFATAATGASFYSKNGIDKAGVSYGDVKAMTDGLVDTGVVGPRRSLGTMGDDPSLTAGAVGDTATRFASTYLGKDQKQAQADYFGSVPDHSWPGNTAPGIGRVGQVQTASTEQGDTASPPAESVSYTPDPSLTEFPDRPRSNFEKVAAAGIDVGGGLIPGVGLGVGLINGVLSLTGNRTIGERLVDAIATGKGISGAPSKGDPNRPDYQVADSTVPSTTTVPTVESFVDSYLSPPDKTKYPTPYERYDLNRNTYAGV